MKVRALILSLALSLVLAAGAAMAADFGSAAEAKAMLEKAVAAVTADKAKALDAFKAKAGEFGLKDLYVFCGGPDGIFTAHPSLTGKSLKDLKDKAGKALGEEIYAGAKEGSLVQVSYMWPRPGETEPVKKNTFATKVADQVCAVGYYEP